jgi:hypothetical protein
MKASLHDVFGASVARNDSTGFASLNAAFSSASEFIKRRFEGALVDRLARMRLLNRPKGIHRLYASVGLAKLSNRLRQVEGWPIAIWYVPPWVAWIYRNGETLT